MDRPSRYVPPDPSGNMPDNEEIIAPLLEPPVKGLVEGKPVRRTSGVDVAHSAAVLYQLENMDMAALQEPERLWQQQRPMMIAWLCTSCVALVLFAPFFLSSALFLGAQAAAILGICASCMHLFRGSRITGSGMFQQIQGAVRIGAAAAVLDGVSAVLALLLVSVTECEDDYDMLYEDCQSLSSYLLLFGTFLAVHAYISASVAVKGMQAQRLLNPVSAGILRV